MSPADARAGRSSLSRVLREPVTHFVALAVVLFAVAEGAQSFGSELVEIDPLEVEARIQTMERAQGRRLTEDERRLAEQALIDEVILAREARTRGLDDDARVRAILSQKMLHFLSMGLTQPSDAELRAFFAENEARYVVPASVTVDQLLARSTPPPPDGDPEALGRTDEYRHTVLRDVTRNELSMTFGVETADRIFDTDDRAWVGPHLTDQGTLWFRTVERFGRRPAPPFESVIGQVRFDWMTEHEERYLQERLEELRRGYRIRMLDDDSGGR